MKKLIATILFAAMAAGMTCGCAKNWHGLGTDPNFMGEHPEVDEQEVLTNEEFKKPH
jgi:hypothetical protein